MRRLNNGVGTFVISGWAPDMEKLPEACHRSLRTKAMASANVGSGLGIPSGRPGNGRAFFVGQVSCQRYPGEESKKRRCRTGDGPVGPLTLGLHSQMSAYFLECHLQLPAQHEPLHDLDRGGREVGGQQRLGTELPQGVSNQDPSNRHWMLARVVPEGGLGSDFHGTDGTVIPSWRGLGPARIRRVKEFLQGVPSAWATVYP